MRLIQVLSSFALAEDSKNPRLMIPLPHLINKQSSLFPYAVNFSNDRSKSVDINIPNIEVMLDFLKIKFLSRYVDKLMEWKKYLDYKKALQEQINSQRKSPQVGPQDNPNFQNIRKGSFDLNPQDNANYTHRKRQSEVKYPSFTNLDNNLMPNPRSSGAHNKIRIAGCDIDLNYFQKSNTPEETNDTGERPQKEMNVNFEGLSELASEPFELTADNLLDTSNVHINLNMKSIYIYLLKSCSAFLELEFRRRWLFGGDPQADFQKSFNKKIPINYFQLKCTNINLSMHTKEGSTALSFSTFKILDVNRIETPLKLKSSHVSAPASNFSGFKSQNPWNRSEVFHSFRMDKSTMMTSGLRFPELKRNVSNVSDPNDSVLFQSAMSDVTKDFLTMREIRKQIIDWDLDPKREHFCVNVVFKFNKRSHMDFSKEKKGSDTFKTVKYLEDSIIHCPLNTDPLTKEVPNAQAKPTLRFQAKGPKIVASLDLPPVYVNFYMGLVHDINFLLHNASDPYKILENWYLEQNQNLIRKWEQELREVYKQEDHPKEENSKKREKEAVTKEKIDEVVEAYYKRQNQLLSLDVSLAVPIIKIAINLETPKKDTNQCNQCFCGFSSHYFADNLSYNPLFKKDFVITELSQLMIKVLKVPSSEHFYAQGGSNMKKITALQTHVLFQNLDIYVPSKMKDENKVLMMKLLSIHPVHFEGNLIVPSIMLTTYEDSNSVLVAKNTEQNSRKDLVNLISENRPKEGQGKNKNGPEKNEEERKMDFDDKKEEPSWQTSQKIYCAFFQRHMNKHMASDPDYLKLLDEDATGSLKVTIPRFEVFVSKQTLEFLRSFSKDGLTLIEDFNTKLAQLIDQEKRLFTSFLETTKPQKAPPVANLSLYVEEIAINLLQDEKVNQSFYQISEAKNKLKKKVPNLGDSDILLDASTGAWEKSFSASAVAPQISAEMRLHYPEKEFEKVLDSSVKILLRHSEAIIYKNPKELVDIVHLEIHDLLVVDKLQEKPCFGSFQKGPGEGVNEVNKEYLDAEQQYEAQECIVYKQSCWNSWDKPLSVSRIMKEPEAFTDLRKKGIFILENPHIAFDLKNKNVLNVGVLKHIRDEKQKVEIEARIGLLVFRSDLKFGFIDVLSDIASCFKQNPAEKKEEPNEHINSVYSIEKREIFEEPSLTIQCSLENIIVDINPYINYDYCKTFGKINFGIDPDSLEFEQKDLLFYADIRSLVALESLTLKLNKKGNKVQFDRFEVTSLDVLLRHQKPDPNLKENRIILRSKEDSFFGSEFEELTHLYNYKSHPLYLSGLSVVALGEDMKKLDLKLSKVELNLYADTIPTIEKHLHLILCLIEKRKQVNSDQQDIIEEEQKEEPNMASSKQEGSSKPKDYVIVADEIEIDKEFFTPIDVISKSKQSMNIGVPKEDDDEGFEDVEEIEDESGNLEVEDSNKSYETVNSMPSVSSSFVSSSTVFYFDEDNLHDFTLGNQIVAKKLNFKIDEICLKIFETYEFDSDPILMEIPMPPSGEENNNSRSTELQTILMSHDQKRFEKLPKGINENEKAECIMVVLENFSMGLIHFSKNENLRTNLAWRASVMLENFEILDCFKNSKKDEANVRLFGKFVQKSPNGSRVGALHLSGDGRNSGIKISNTFDAIFECFEHNKCQQKDLRAFIVIHPIEIYFGTPHYNFTKLFLAKMSLKSPAPQLKDNNESGIIQNKSLDYSGFQRQKKSSDIFISFCHIAPVELKMNLNLDISIINLDLFKNLTLSFPSLVIRGAENSDDVKKEAIEFYTKRVKKQLGKFIKDLPILRNIKNLTSATFNIFYSPYLNYRESGNLLYGLKDGFFGFVGSVSNESANLLTFVTTMVDNAANLTGIRERLTRSDSPPNQ